MTRKEASTNTNTEEARFRLVHFVLIRAMADQQFADLFRSLSDKLNNLGLNDLITPFSGEPSQFRSWINAIDKCAIINSVPDNKKKLLAYRFSTGRVSDFIQRYFTENPNCTWIMLKAELSRRYGEVTDQFLQFANLRNIKQNREETVQDFGERIITLARDAYEGFGGDAMAPLIDHQLIGFFIDGLKDESIKSKLISNTPADFQAAIQAAVREQDVKIKVKIRTSQSMPQYHADDRDRPHKRNDYRDYSSMEIDKIQRTQDRFCNHCKTRSHYTSDCRRRKNNPHSVNNVDNERNARSFSNRGNENGGYTNNYQTAYNRHSVNSHANARFRPQDESRKFDMTRVECYFCHRFGHFKSQCREYMALQGRQQNYSKNM